MPVLVDALLLLPAAVHSALMATVSEAAVQPRPVQEFVQAQEQAGAHLLEVQEAAYCAWVVVARSLATLVSLEAATVALLARLAAADGSSEAEVVASDSAQRMALT